jgi:hypothetical protein
MDQCGEFRLFVPSVFRRSLAATERASYSRASTGPHQRRSIKAIRESVFIKERISVERLMHPDTPLEVLFDDDKCLVIA